MLCPKCNSKTLVLDSRPCTYNATRRRYRCTKCGFRFTTYEGLKQHDFRAMPSEIYDALTKSFTDDEMIKFSVDTMMQTYWESKYEFVDYSDFRKCVDLYKKLLAWKSKNV